jgi:quercetin dioxygenase-like cupin family protein
MQHYDLNEVENDEVNPAYVRKVVRGEALTIAKIEVGAGEVTLTHSHDNEEMIYVLKGRWLFHLPDGDVILTDNHMLCIPADTEHSSEALEDTIALDICSKNRPDWLSGQDKILHNNPEQFLWAV